MASEINGKETSVTLPPLRVPERIKAALDRMLEDEIRGGTLPCAADCMRKALVEGLKVLGFFAEEAR